MTVTIPVGITLKKAIIEATLSSTGGNVSAAAKILAIDRSTLYSKMERHQIPR